MKQNINTNYQYTFVRNLVVTGLWMLYLTEKGFTPFEVGLMEAAFHGASFLFEVPSGSIGDRFGYRNTLIASCVVNIISCLFTVLSNNFWLVAFGFVLSSLSYCLASGTTEALVFESLLAKKQESRYINVSANISVLMELSMSLGIVIAGLMSTWYFDGVYWIQIALSVICILIALRFVEPKRPAHIQEKYFQLMKSAFVLTKSIPNLIVVMLSFAFIDALNATYYFYFQNYFAEIGIAGLGISLVIVVSSIFQVLGAKLAPAIEKRLSMSRLFLIVFILLAACIGLSSFLPNILVVVCYILANTLCALISPIRSNFINQLIPSGKRATINSIDSLCFSLMMIPMFPITGGLLHLLGYRQTFTILAIVIVIGGLIGHNKLKSAFSISS